MASNPFAALCIFLATAGVPAMAQTSFNATFDSSPDPACSSGDNPCNSFTTTLGGVDFEFTFTSQGDGGDLLWLPEYGEDNLGSMDCRSASYDVNTLELITIKRADGEDFIFTSIFLNNTAGVDVNIGAYNDNSLVGTLQSVPATGNGEIPGTTFDFENILVDEVRITGTDFFNFNFDSFKGVIPPPNTAPVVTTSGGSTVAMEQFPTAIDAGITVSDAENSTLPSARVAITSSFIAGQDQLGFANDGATMGNITGSYNSGTGVLTLTSAGATATIAQWQSALRAVTYLNTSDAPNSANRVISFSANDGTVDSATAQKTVAIQAVNDAPVITVPSQITIDSDNAVTLTGISFADPDAGAGIVTATFSVPKGALTGISGSGVTISGNGTTTLVATGTVADLNAYIAASNLQYTKAVGPAETVTMAIGINDNGNTGAGGARSDTDTVTLDITVPVSLSAFSVE